jgi:hypothetical protein
LLKLNTNARQRLSDRGQEQLRRSVNGAHIAYRRVVTKCGPVGPQPMGHSTDMQ